MASSTAATVSFARPTSSVSLSTRPAPRAAVVARPIVETQIDLRPRKAPRMVAPTEIAVWMPCCLACSLSRSTACSARRRRSWSAATLGAYFWRRASLARSRSCRVDSCRRTRKSRSDSPGFETTFSDGLRSSSSFCDWSSQAAKSLLQPS